MKTVSVIMPVYNARDTVALAIGSLGAHACEDVEVIAVDDGSTDGSGELLDVMARESGRLRVLHIPHGGIVQALTAGIEEATGEYIARMDADDESLPGRLDAQRAFLDEREDIGLVGGQVLFGGDRMRAQGYALHVDWLNGLRTPEEIALERFVESPFAHPSVMFRHDLIVRHGGYRDGAFPEDYELWLRWMDAGVRMARIDRPVLRWNDPPQRLSRTDTRYSIDAFYGIKARYLSRYLQRINPFHPEVIIWGSGRTTRRRVRMLQQQGVVVRSWVDVDPDKIGHVIEDAPVIAADNLPGPGEAFSVSFVGNRGARERIGSWFGRHGYRKGVDFLHAA
ncbi:MAG: glycosyltransferase [Bacteroidetes bacterium]|nr:glycosyltransferase [Bacteroidota bacterium]